MNLTNLLRDQVHIVPGQSNNGFATTTIGRASNTVYMNSTGIVNMTSASRHAADQNSNSINIQSWIASGMLMLQPEVDATPYRVKASIVANTLTAHLIIGYAPVGPTGLNDLVTKVTSFPLMDYEVGQTSAKFDDVLLFPSVNEGDSDYGKPIAIGIAVSNQSGNPRISYNISVQNLAVTAPQFAASMS